MCEQFYNSEFKSIFRMSRDEIREMVRTDVSRTVGVIRGLVESTNQDKNLSDQFASTCAELGKARAMNDAMQRQIDIVSRQLTERIKEVDELREKNSRPSRYCLISRRKITQERERMEEMAAEIGKLKAELQNERQKNYLRLERESRIVDPLQHASDADGSRWHVADKSEVASKLRELQDELKECRDNNDRLRRQLHLIGRMAATSKEAGDE